MKISKLCAGSEDNDGGSQKMLLDSTSTDKESEKEVSRLQEISGQPVLDATHRQLTQGLHTGNWLFMPVQESSRVPSEGPSICSHVV